MNYTTSDNSKIVGDYDFLETQSCRRQACRGKARAYENTAYAATERIGRMRGKLPHYLQGETVDDKYPST